MGNGTGIALRSSNLQWILDQNAPMKTLERLAEIKVRLTYCIELLSERVKDVVNIEEVFEEKSTENLWSLERLFAQHVHLLLTVLNHEQWSNWAYSLHIWFLKQMVTRRGMEWTEVLICNKRVRSCCAVFGESQVFTQLKRASANIPSLDAFAVMGDRVCFLHDL